MQADLILRGGTIVTSKDTYVADIAVRGGRILAIGDLAGVRATTDFAARGLMVLPGAIDEHMHARDPGLTDKEDFAHATRAAAAGGVTTILEMPNTVPPVRNGETFHLKAEALAPLAFVDFGLWGLVLGDRNLADLPEMAVAGVVGFKLFWGYGLDPHTYTLVYNFKEGDNVFLPPDEGQILDAFRTIAATGRLVAIHAENRHVNARLAAREEVHGNDYAAFLRSRPAYSEAMTIQAGIELGAASGVHLHILHVSSRDGAALVNKARARGLRVTAETCPHYLELCDEDFPRLGVDMKVYPPIRERMHMEGLWRAVQAGVLQAIGSDHAPHTLAEKRGSIWTAPAGACGVQTLVPLTLNAVSQGRITLNQAVALLAEHPARLFGLYPCKGAIQVGADADFTVVDMAREHVLNRAELLSKHPIAPFHGMRVQGMPVAAFLRGCRIMQDGQPLGTPAGQLVRPERSSDCLQTSMGEEYRERRGTAVG